MMKKYHYYLTTLFLKNLLTVIVVFIFLSFFLNIFEEIKFFENKESGIYFPIILTILNIPSIVFEIFVTQEFCFFSANNLSYLYF